MTEDRKKLIAKFQKWLDTKPSKELIASQCANIAEEYHSEQSMLSEVSHRREMFDKFYKWLDNLTESEYDDMSLTEKIERYFFKNKRI